MRVTKILLQRGAIAVGAGLTIAAGAGVYWYFNPQNGCVRTLSTGGKPASGQEVVYVWGCFHPQRFRQWSVTALRSQSFQDADSQSAHDVRLV